MSLRCSVFGHNYGASEVEREREEDGSEVVTTVRETETCLRCGETRVVSENKEVTTLETAADIVGDELDDAEQANDGPDDSEPAPPGEPAETAEPSGPAETGESSESAEPAGESATTADPSPDDTSIPDAEGGSVTAGQPPAGDPPDAAEDDGVILDDGDDEDTEREAGEWPDEPDDGDDEWEPETSPVHDDGPDIEQTGTAVTVPEGSFHCPECDYTTPVEESSLRAGDFCPACHKGSLEHHSE